jgi:hypothetical protein
MFQCSTGSDRHPAEERLSLHAMSMIEPLPLINFNPSVNHPMFQKQRIVNLRAQSELHRRTARQSQPLQTSRSHV